MIWYGLDHPVPVIVVGYGPDKGIVFQVFYLGADHLPFNTGKGRWRVIQFRIIAKVTIRPEIEIIIIIVGGSQVIINIWCSGIAGVRISMDTGKLFYLEIL